MPKERSAPRVALLSVLVLGVLLSLAPSAAAGPPNTSSANCTITTTGPFLYAGMVFPDIEVRCDSEVNRIRVEGVLEMDGVQVDAGVRDCRKTARCTLSVDLRAADQPGDQTWCASASATIGGKESVGSSSSCETADF